MVRRKEVGWLARQHRTGNSTVETREINFFTREYGIYMYMYIGSKLKQQQQKKEKKCKARTHVRVRA